MVYADEARARWGMSERGHEAAGRFRRRDTAADNGIDSGART